MGGAANKIILGCQAFGLLSEQAVAKNSSEGQAEHSGTEGVRGNTGAASKMASKGENMVLGVKRQQNPRTQTMFRFLFTIVSLMVGYCKELCLTSERKAVKGWKPLQ